MATVTPIHRASQGSFREPQRQLLNEVHAHLTGAIAAASCSPALRPLVDGLLATKRDVIRFELEQGVR
jgi:hypothetical protein